MGMVVMALEAVKQLAMVDNRQVSGFLFKQGQLLAPITVGETFQDATETELHLRPLIRAYEKETKSFEARIYSYHDGRWFENFRTEVQVQYEEKQANDMDNGRETHLYHQQVCKHVENAMNQCEHKILTESFYSFVANSGSRLGGLFQHLDDIRWSGSSSTGAAKISMNTARKHYRSADSPVHPTVLDASLAQLQISFLSNGLVDQISTLVPQQFAHLWVSSKIWDQSTANIRIVCEIHGSSSVLTSTAIPLNVYALADDGSPLAIAQRLAVAEVSRAEDHQDSNSMVSMLYGISWKPQLSALSGRELQKLCDTVATHQDNTALIKSMTTLNEAMTEAARKALQTMTPEHIKNAPKYFHRYTASLRRQAGLSDADGGRFETMSDEALETLLVQCETEILGWRLFPMIARSLGPIVRNEVDPMELFFSDELSASTFYSELFQILLNDGRFSHFMDLATHENPGLKVFEVGAGTGGMTKLCVNPLSLLFMLFSLPTTPWSPYYKLSYGPLIPRGLHLNRPVV